MTESALVRNGPTLYPESLSVFSSRIASDLTPNRLSAAIARLRAAGLEFDDLTESNPTRVGIEYPGRLLDALAHPSGLHYAPSPSDCRPRATRWWATFAAAACACPAIASC